MNLYDEFYPLVLEMLDEFGGDATLVSSAPAGPSIDAKRTGRAVPASPPLRRPARVAVGPIERAGANGRLTFQTVATMLVEPREGDIIEQGDMKWTVGAVTKIAPQGKAIVFMAEVS